MPWISLNMLYVSYESYIVKVFIGWETVSFLWIVRFFPSVFLFKQIKQCHNMPPERQI